MQNQGKKPIHKYLEVLNPIQTPVRVDELKIYYCHESKLF